MKYAIVGSRSFRSYDVLKEVMDKFDDVTCIISGGAIGADSLAAQYAAEKNIFLQEFKPDWSMGKQAGMVRNADIIDNCDILVAFWDFKSKGTANSIQRAAKKMKPSHIIDIRKESRLTGVHTVLS